MQILIAGGTGFVGRHLIPQLLELKHQVWVIGRDVKKIKACFANRVHALAWGELNSLAPDEFQAVINLAGKNIGDGRFTKASKAEIIHSRVDATRTLVTWCKQATNKPHLYNASAIGIYGLQSSNDWPPPMNENMPIPVTSDFIQQVGKLWEEAALEGKQAGVPVTLMRFGVVLKRGEGVLKKLEPSYYFGLGGRLGSGKQPFTWVHIDDLISAIIFLLNHPEIQGAVNICSPHAVTQAYFAKTLAHVMHRPAIFTTPAWLLKLVFGQMAEELLLNGQHVYPKRLLDHQFVFKLNTLDQALKHDWVKS